MHQLVWSEDLVEILKPLDLSGSWADFTRKTWRYGQIVSYQNFSGEVEQEMKVYLGKTEADRKTEYEGTMNQMELLNPRQTVIGCHLIPEGASKNVTVCSVGPEGQLYDISKKSTGTPGSSCLTHYKNEDGICVPEDPAKVSYFGYYEDFLVELNEVRQKYASEYGVPNMHQLVWNEDLVKIINSLDWSVSWEGTARINWRYAKLVSYRGIAHAVEEEIQTVSQKSEDEMKSFYGLGTMGVTELMSPRQIVIGCGKKQGGNAVFPVCLIGAIGTGLLWDFKTKSTDGPGSACSPHYKNENGLCVPENPGQVSHLGSHEDFLVELNAVRQKYANEYNVPDMHQLIWSTDLVDILGYHDWSEDWPTARKTWRYAKVDSYRNIAQAVEKEIKTVSQKSEDEMKALYNGNWMGSIELMSPLQTVIGCGKKQEGNAVFPVCLIGTIGTGQLWDFKTKSTDDPGSACSPHYKNENGLCVPENPDQVSYLGYHEDFLVELNSVRQKYANEYNVPDMHQLVWGDQLVDILRYHDWSESWPTARKTWRYAKVDSYRNIAQAVEEEIQTVSQKSEDEMKALYNQNWMGSIELMSPRQTVIGCAKKQEGNAVFPVCLIGAIGEGQLWNFNTKSSETPGSACSAHYQNKEGLCVPVDPAEVTYLGYKEDFLVEVNSLRQKYAKEYNVPNMNQLIWSEDLARLIDKSRGLSENSATWQRVPNLVSYRNPTKVIEYEMKLFLNMSADDKKKLFDGDTHTTLILLNPVQTVIGCFEWWTGQEAFVICLVGTDCGTLIVKVLKRLDLLAPRIFKISKGLCVPVDSAKVSYLGSQEEFLVELNSVRQKYANEYNVPNMNQLVWSEDLVKVVDTNLKTENYTTWRSAQLNTYRNPTKLIEDEMKQFLEKSEDEKKAAYDGNSISVLELLNPSQTVVGCSNFVKAGEIVVVCLVGTEYASSLWDFQSKFAVAPGSACSKRYINNNGLCVPENAATVSDFGSFDVFVDEVNEMRNRFAKEYNVPNMHQLIWHQELADVANTLHWNDPWNYDRVAWRYMVVDTPLKSNIKDIRGWLEGFLAKIEQEKKEYIEGDVNFYVDRLELLNPEQTLIGCGQLQNDVEKICLLGPLGKWPEGLIFAPNPAEVPGSKCLDGYENVDGLCSLPKPTPKPTPSPKPVTQRIPQRVSSAQGAATAEAEPDAAPTRYSPYLMISISMYYFLV